MLAVWGYWWLILLCVRPHPRMNYAFLLTGLEEQQKFQEAPASRSSGDCVHTSADLHCRCKGDLWKEMCGQSLGQGVSNSPHRRKKMGSLTLCRALVNCHQHTPVLQSPPSSGPPSSSKQHTGACTLSQARCGCSGGMGEIQLLPQVLASPAVVWGRIPLGHLKRAQAQAHAQQI